MQLHCVTGSPFEDRVITADEDHRRDVILNEINMQYRNQQAPWTKKDRTEHFVHCNGFDFEILVNVN